MAVAGVSCAAARLGWFGFPVILASLALRPPLPIFLAAIPAFMGYESGELPNPVRSRMAFTKQLPEQPSPVPSPDAQVGAQSPNSATMSS